MKTAAQARSAGPGRPDEVAIAVAGLPNAFILFESGDRLVMANRAAWELYGQAPEALEPGVTFDQHLRYRAEKGLHSRTAEDGESWIRDRIEGHNNTPRIYEESTRCGRWLLVHEDRTDSGATVIVETDITERKEQERQSAWLAAATEKMSEALSLWDGDDRLAAYNKVWRDANIEAWDGIELGMTFEAFLRVLIAKGLCPQAIGRETEWLDDRMYNHRNPRGPTRVSRQGGLEHLSYERRLPGGGTVLLSADISDLVTAEKALRDSESRLRDLIDTSSDRIWETDENHRLKSLLAQSGAIATDKTFSFLGLTAWEIAGVVPDCDADWRRHKDTLDNHRPFREFVARFPRQDGTTFWWSISGNPVFDDLGAFKGHPGTARDIIAAKKAEAQLLQTSKLATLGEMATGIAHELNQPLNVIRMAADSLNELLGGGDDVPVDVITKKLVRISEQTERASAIIDHMRLFGRKSGGEAEPFDICEVIRAAAGLTEKQLLSVGISLTYELPDSPIFVVGESIQLEQVILNFVGNARDAILALTDAGNPSREGAIGISVSVDRDRAEIRVVDNGGGIPENVLRRVFEPFFTTKEVGTGTGLGLSISYGIITEMNGTVSATNIDDGACLSIILPVASP